MERFSSKIGTCTFLGFLIMGILDVGLLMFWGLSGIWIPFLAFTAIFILFVVPPFFFTHYSLTQDYLKITCLWIAFGKKIKYEDIVAVVPCESAKVSAKLANSCIRIVYMKKGKTKEIFVSPVLGDRFINQLTDNVLYSTVIEQKKYDEANMKLEGITKPLYMIDEELDKEEKKPKRAAKKPAAKKSVAAKQKKPVTKKKTQTKTKTVKKVVRK